MIYYADSLLPRRDFPEPHIFYGLDLGRRKSRSALAVLERASVATGRVDPVTRAQIRNLHFVLRHIEQCPHGVHYLDVRDRVRDLIRHLCSALPPGFELLPGHPQNPHKTLVIDAGGVGAPVVELFHQADLRATIAPITITSGSHFAKDPFGGYLVPRRDLLTNLRILLEHRLLVIPESINNYRELKDELLHVTDKSGHRRDDLALALSLATWQATQGLNLTNYAP